MADTISMSDETISSDTRLLIKILSRNKTESNRKLTLVLAEQRLMRQKIEALEGAFPGSDLEGHRRFHENVIEWYELRNRIVREVLVNTAKVGTIGTLGWLGWLVWQWLRVTVTRS